MIVLDLIKLLLTMPPHKEVRINIDRDKESEISHVTLALEMSELRQQKYVVRIHSENIAYKLRGQ